MIVVRILYYSIMEAISKHQMIAKCSEIDHIWKRCKNWIHPESLGLTWLDGTLFWCTHGKLHRDETDNSGQTLPAVIRPDGTKEWWQHNMRYRTDTDDNGQTLLAMISPNETKM